jgi:hypothetical protein
MGGCHAASISERLQGGEKVEVHVRSVACMILGVSDASRQTTTTMAKKTNS